MTLLHATATDQVPRKFIATIPAHDGPASFTIANPIHPDVDVVASLYTPDGGWVSGGFRPTPTELTFSFEVAGGPYRVVLIG
ncbi:hypothetical protein BJY16_006149 [Actinoplanes octamycinicus]|uniref:Uncharacterized protein n=1 Tax=Actinoplanes octamycinicus TaxID=135948 RepID=A0A7W7H2C9_9ACTN|nr:hypothetical protein [Actinoplanes octamycinicus]MBB4742690.1 hypothetical protein [Actinoplanes octamycinicus]